MAVPLRPVAADVPIVGGNAFNSSVMIGNLEDAAEGLIVGGAWRSAMDSAGNQEFIDAYTQAYGRLPSSRAC